MNGNAASRKKRPETELVEVTHRLIVLAKLIDNEKWTRNIIAVHDAVVTVHTNKTIKASSVHVT